MKHLLRSSEDDILSWEISRGKPSAEALCLISCLKSTGCAAPLLADEDFGEEIRQYLIEGLSYLPVDRSTLLSKIIESGFASLGTDTLENIDRIGRKCTLIFEAVFNP